MSGTGQTPPLAWRMRPRDLREYTGQDHIIGPDAPLRRAIEEDRLHSLILYGPPGSGKTSLAAVIANATAATFVRLSAVSAGVKDVRRVLDEAAKAREEGQGTVLFIDEIHRFNKSQQDALLPGVEDGVVVLIGATTENPFFEVNSPLISRSRMYVLKPLADAEVQEILRRAVADVDRGLGGKEVDVDEGVPLLLAKAAGGDARAALNALETAARTAAADDGKLSIELARRIAGGRALVYDKGGDAHYDVTSAFIKSLRGSDPDAAVYWLARMIDAGEDPKFIARRMVIFASEDIGNADPHALMLATAAADAVQFVGLPECRLNLAQAALYLAVAAKSNAVIKAINAAAKDVRTGSGYEVPAHLRDAHYGGAKKLGHGKGYRYPHASSDHWVDQEYLPENLKGRRYYEPSDSGVEKKIAARLRDLRK